MPVIFHLMISTRPAAQASSAPAAAGNLVNVPAAATPASPVSNVPSAPTPPFTPEPPVSAAAAAAAAAAARAAAAAQAAAREQSSPAANISSQQPHQTTGHALPSPDVAVRLDEATSSPPKGHARHVSAATPAGAQPAGGVGAASALGVRGISVSGSGSVNDGNVIGGMGLNLSQPQIEGAESPLQALLRSSTGSQGGLPPSPEQMAALMQLQQELHEVYYKAYYKAYLDNLTPRTSPAAPAPDGLVTPGHQAQAGAEEQGNGVHASCGHGAGADAAPLQTGPGTVAEGQMHQQDEDEAAVVEPPDAGNDVHLLPGARAHVNAANARNPERDVPDRGQDGPGQNHKSVILALKLALVVCVLGQDASRERLMALCACATAIFLHQTGILRVSLSDSALGGLSGSPLQARPKCCVALTGRCDAQVFGWLQAIVEGLQYMAPDARIYDDFEEYEPEDEDEQPDAVDGGAEGADGAVADGGQRRRDSGTNRREYQGGGEGFTGLLVDISALLVGFFTSLVPRTPPEANGF